MEKLKEALIQFAHSNPSLFPNDAANSYPKLIEQCFRQFFTDYQTPNHPPYAAMIYRAIWELNKKGGSDEESISNYIKQEYADLPWAHSTLLKHHLEKLCDRKEICMTHNQCYLLAGAELESEKQSIGPSKKRKRQTGQPGSEMGKKGGRPHKKHKKNEKTGSGIQEVKDKEQKGLHKRKRKQVLKSKIKGNKRAKKHALSEANLKRNNEVAVDEQIDADQESDQGQTKKIPEILQLEESPNSNPILHGNGKRVWTRSQLKTVSKKDALSSLDKPLIELVKPVSSKPMTRVIEDEPTTGPCSTDVRGRLVLSKISSRKSYRLMVNACTNVVVGIQSL